MASAPYILAASYEDAYRFGTETLGLGKGRFFIVNSPAGLRGLAGADLHLVPGWSKRYDHFSFSSMLRWTRLNVITHDTPTEDAGESTTGTEGDEHESIHDATSFFQVAAEKAPVRRRRRCKECGVLVEPDDVDGHAAEHAAMVP